MRERRSGPDADCLVGKLLSQCSTRYPRIKLTLQEDYSPAVRVSLLSGRLDIGIMSCEAQHPELVCQPIFCESMWLIGRPRDWRLPRDVVKPTALDKLPLLVGSFMRTLLAKHVDRFGVELNVVAEADSLSLAREALRAGAGFFVAPFSALDRELKAKEFLGAPLQGLEVSRGLFRHRDRPPARAAVTLSEMLEGEIAKLYALQSDAFRSISIEPSQS